MKLILTLTLMLATLQSFADPSENSSATLSRNAQSPLSLSVQLSKNVYNSVPYDAHYTVQVPYEAQEAYQENETTYQNQYVCHDVTSYRQECHDEQDCNNSFVSLATLITVQDRSGNPDRPGLYNPGGPIRPGPSEPPPGYNPGPITPGPSEPPPRQCYTRQVCENEPYITQQCGYEQVPVVTTVTKYRTVTLYRDEDRCCVTKYQDVFDHQDQLRVDVIFPQDSALDVNEQESFTLQMVDLKNVNISVDDSIFGYEVASQSVSNGVAQIVLKTVPKYSEKEIGLDSIEGLSLKVQSGQGTISFNDKGLRPRVQTLYAWEVVEQESNTQVSTGTLAASATGAISTAVPVKLDIEKTYVVNLRVSRQGVVLANTIQFQAQVIRAKTPVDTAKVVDSSLVSDPQVKSVGNGTYSVQVTDSLPDFSEVTSTYDVKIERHGGFLNLGWKTLAEKTVPRPKGDIATLSLDVQKDLGVSASDMSSYVKSGATVRVTVTVNRVSALVNGGKATQIQKQSKFNLP